MPPSTVLMVSFTGIAGAAGTDAPVDELPGDERPGTIVDGAELDLLAQGIQALAHGLLAALAAGHHGGDLGTFFRQIGDGQDQILPGDDDDFRNGVAILELSHRPPDHGLSAKLCHNLVDAAHPGSGACRYDHHAAGLQGQQFPGRPGNFGNIHGYSSFTSFL